MNALSNLYNRCAEPLSKFAADPVSNVKYAARVTQEFLRDAISTILFSQPAEMTPAYASARPRATGLNGPGLG